MKTKNSKEFFDRIKRNAFFNVNESKYREIVDLAEDFDELPIPKEAGEQEDAEKPEGSVPAEPSNDPTVDVTEPPVPEFDNGGEIDGIEDSMAVPEPEADVDSIQNEIIKMNTLTMKSVYDKLEQLNGVTDTLNDRISHLTLDVEEVKEPTDAEKMIERKKVSYPYYFGLNDMWSDNWFDQEREKEGTKGIKKLPDGTYVADFDDIKGHSDTDINDSFNEF